MPLMHSERIADQRLSLAYFTRLGTRFGAPFACTHYRMIARFGRFPHRNAVLGRRSSPAEIAAVAAGNHWSRTDDPHRLHPAIYNPSRAPSLLPIMSVATQRPAPWGERAP